MKKIIVGLVIMSMCLFLGTSKAMASTAVTWSFDGIWNWGTVYDFDGATWTPVNSNPYYGTPSQSLTNATVTGADGTEDSYSTGRITAITPTGGGTPLFNAATDPYELTAFLYGVDDIYIEGTMSSSRLLATGGMLRIYQDYAKNYDPYVPLDPAADRFDLDPTPGDQGDGFTTVTDGTLVLELTPKVRTDPDSGADYTFENFFSFSTLAGTGNMLLDVTDGIWADYYNTNTQNLGADFNITFTALPTGAVTGWTVSGAGTGTSSVVPEPASMLLFGIGMLGFGVTRKRKKTA